MSLKHKASRTKSLSLSDDFLAAPRPATGSAGTALGGIAAQRLGSATATAAVGSLLSSAVAAASGGAHASSSARSARLGGGGPRRVEDTGKIFKYIDDNVIGKGVAFLGPFGRRKGESINENVQ